MKKLIIKLFLKGIAVTVLAQIITLILSVLCIMFLSNNILSVVFGLAELLILCGMYINFAYRESADHKKKYASKKLEKSVVYPFVMSAGSSVPLLFTWTLLFLSSRGVLPDTLMLYKVADMFFYFVTDKLFNIYTVSQIDSFRLFVLFICTGFPFVIMIPSYFSTIITGEENNSKDIDK